MHTIIKKIVKQRGIDILYAKTLISCMDDEGAFDDIEMRSYKKILRTIVAEDYTHKLVEIGAWNAEAETLARTFAQRNKLQEDEIIYVFSCLAYGLGWLKITPQIPAEVKKKRQQEAQKKAKEVEAAQKRNEEVIRKNAEEAARKKAEIAEKRALEAERQAAEAERKAKEAEKIAKERADKQAANLVISMIKNIGVIESTKECRDKVSAALLAYKMLNSSQQVLVDLQVGDALQRMADETKKIAEDTARKKVEEARKKAEKEALEKAKAEADRKKKRNIILIIASLLLISILYILFAGIEGVDTHSESKVLKELNTTDNSSVVSRHEHYNENNEQKRMVTEQEKAKITNYKRNIVYAKSAEELLNIYNAIQQEDMNKDSAQVLLGLAAEMLYFCYKDGVGGVSQNRSAAINWLEKAANHGSPDAMEIIGYAYLYQLGYYSSECSLDPKKAYYWLEKAIKLNPDNEDLNKAYNKAQKIVSTMNEYGDAKMSWKIERRRGAPLNDRYFILNVVKKQKYLSPEVIDEELQKYKTVEKEYEYEEVVLEEKLYYSGNDGTWLY